MAEMGWHCRLCEAVIPRDKPESCQTCGYKIYACLKCETRYPAFLGRCPSCAAVCQEEITAAAMTKLRQAFPSVFGLATTSSSQVELERPGTEAAARWKEKHEDLPGDAQDDRYATNVTKAPPPRASASAASSPVKKSAITKAIEENGDCPVALQIESPRPLSENLEGELHIRLRPFLGETEYYAEVNCIGSALKSHYHDEAPLEGSPQTLDPIGFKADTPGLLLLRFTLLLSDNAGQPLGRWVSSVSMYVEEEASGTYIRVGGELLQMEEIAPHTPPPQTKKKREWKTVRLKRDRHFDQTVLRTPTDVFPAPPDFFAYRGTSTTMSKGHGLLTLKGTQGERRIAIHVGEEALLGRGSTSDESNHFPLQTDTPDKEHNVRISRVHARLLLKNNRAWLVPVGTNFSAINGTPVPNDEEHELADGDEISLAGELEFKVRLWKIQDSAAAIRLTRKDKLADRLSYLVVLGETPFPWIADPDGNWNDPVFWGAFATNNQSELVLLRYSDQKSDWLPVRHTEAALGHHWSIKWHPFEPDSREQEDYLG